MMRIAISCRLKRGYEPREAYGVRRIPALWIYFMDKNEKRRDAAHSIRFALLDAFLISQAQESTLPA